MPVKFNIFSMLFIEALEPLQGNFWLQLITFPNQRFPYELEYLIAGYPVQHYM